MKDIMPIIKAMVKNPMIAIIIFFQIALTLGLVSNAINIIEQRNYVMQRISGLAEPELFGFNSRFIENDTAINREDIYRTDLETLRNYSGIKNAVIINQIPLSGSGDSNQFSTKLKGDGNKSPAGVFRCDEMCLDTLGVELLYGRNFNRSEIQFIEGASRGSAVLITKGLALSLFSEKNVVGKHIYNGVIKYEVIGVIEKMQGAWADWNHFEKNIILPQIHIDDAKRYLVKVETEKMSEVMLAIPELLSDNYSGRVISRFRTMQENRERSYKGDHMMTQLLSVVLVLIIVITLLGILGLGYFTVSQRTKQIGTRRALGATRWNILRYYLLENMIIAILGITFGVFLSITFNVWMSEHMELSPLEPKLLFFTALGIMVAGQLAVWLPARKASEISPAIATRSV